MRKSKVLLRVIRAFAGAFVVATHATAQSPHPPADSPAATCSYSHLKEHVIVAGAEFETFRDDDAGQACLRVKQGGKILFQRTNGNNGEFAIGQKADASLGAPAIAPGEDVTGNGKPNVLVSLWTGGAHCCRIDYVFEMRPRVTLLATLQARDADQSYFVNLAHDGSFRYVTGDWAFAYWHGSFGGSPVHEVVLRFLPSERGGAYHLDWEAMHRPVPTAEEWQKMRDRVRAEVELKQKGMVEHLRGALWQEVLDLVYTGHPDLAWKLLTEAGPYAQSPDDPNLNDFCGTLKDSLYWNDLKGHLGHAPRECLRATRKR